MKARSQLWKHGLVVLLIAPQVVMANPEGAGTVGHTGTGFTKEKTSVGSVLKTYLGFSSAEIVRQHTRELLPRAQGMVMSIQDVAQIQNAVRGGETVVLSYEMTEAESRQFRIEQVKKEIADWESKVQSSSARREKLQISDNGKDRYRVRIGHAEDEIRRGGVEISLLQDELARVQNGTKAVEIQKRVATISGSGQHSQAIVDQFLLERLTNESHLVSAQAVSTKGIEAARSARSSVRLRTGAGVVGIAAAVAGGTMILLSGSEDSSSENIAVFRPSLVTPARATEK